MTRENNRKQQRDNVPVQLGEMQQQFLSKETAIRDGYLPADRAIKL